MPETETFGSFLQETRKLAKEYLDIRLETYRLMLIRLFSKSAGYLIWIIVSLCLVSLFFVFAGLATGFWLSEITGSYTKGFGLTTLIVLAVVILLALFRKALFVNPIVRKIIRRSVSEKGMNDKDE
jgi:hypothetical protein